jgi:two-component system phosphate regulon response regulator PhoB
MPRERILVIDDEDDLLDLVGYNLTREGYRVNTARTGEEAFKRIREESPDLIILDLMLPGIDGFDVCKQLKSNPRTASIPIVMLTAKTAEADQIAGLELGSDDYVSKPFSPSVLLARIKAVLRRTKSETIADKRMIAFQGLLIDPSRHEVLVEGTPRTLTASEFKILYYLARRPGWVFSREQIIAAVKGEDYPVTDRSVDVQIVGLRKKLGPAGEFIETVRGVGYRFREKPEEEDDT